MQKFFSYLKKHRIAVLLALLVGVLSVFPYIAAPLMLGEEYKGFQFPSASDEEMYRARVHEVLDGHPLITSPYFYEYKDTTPVGVPPIGELLHGLPAFIFGLSPTITAMKFILPAVLFLLVYTLMLGFSGRKEGVIPVWSAITGALLVTLGFDFVNYRNIFSTLNGDVTHLLVWTRLVNPITGAVLLFAYLSCLWRITERTYKYAYIIAGVLLSLMVGYFFSFGIALAILAVLFAIFLIHKEYAIAKELVFTFAISFLLDAWFWYNIAVSMGGEEGERFAERNGMTFTHDPVINKILVATAIFVGSSFIYSYYVRKSRENTHAWIFLFAFILGGFLSFNQQVITGREVWFEHFVLYTIPLSFVAVLTAGFLVWRPRFPRLWLFGMCVIAAASLTWGVSSAASFTNGMEDFKRLQRYSPLFSWVESHAERDCVILVKEPNVQLDLYIPAYTGCNSYISTYPFFGPPPERILHHYLLRLRLNDVRIEDIDTYLSAHEGEIRSYFFDNWRQSLLTQKDDWLSRKTAYVRDGYREFMKGDLKEQINRYKFDYMVSEAPLPEKLQSELPGLREVNHPGNFFVYAFKP
jgi:hypothetical protein